MTNAQIARIEMEISRRWMADNAEIATKRIGDFLDANRDRMITVEGNREGFFTLVAQ